MNQDKGKTSKPADKGKVKDLPSKKLSGNQESSVKGGGTKSPSSGPLGNRDLLKGR